MAVAKAVAVACGAVVVVVAAAAGAAMWLGPRYLEPLVEDQVAQATGRRLDIEGGLKIDPGWITRLYVRNARFANAPWAAQPEMASVGLLAVQLDLWHLITEWRLVLPQVSLIRSELALERNAAGEANWDFGEANDGAAEPASRDSLPAIGRIVIENFALDYRDAVKGIDLQAGIDELLVEEKAGPEGKTRLAADGRGSFAGKPVRLEATGGTVGELIEGTAPYPLDIELVAGKTTLLAEGAIARPALLEGIDLAVSVEGANLAELFEPLRIAMLETSPYRLGGRLGRSGERWEVRELDGRIGDSDIRGEVAFEPGSERPHIWADLVSERLDFDDLAPLLGLPPSTDPGEAATLTQKREAKAYARSERLIPNAKIDVRALRNLDAELSFKGRSVAAPNLPLENLAVDLTLADGVLTLDPAEATIADGRMRATLAIDAREDPAPLSLDVAMRGMQLQDYLSDVGLGEQGAGIVSGRVRLDGRGDSLHQVLDTADGHVGLSMRGGELSAYALEGVGIDIGQLLTHFLTDDEADADDQNFPIRCMVADFTLDSGALATNAVVLDTTDSTVFVDGRIGIATETLDLRVRASPKDASLLSARSPITVGGRWREPEIAVDAGPLVGRGAAAAVLGTLAGIVSGGLLAPLGAAIPFIEPGLGEDQDCKALLSALEASGRPDQ